MKNVWYPDKSKHIPKGACSVIRVSYRNINSSKHIFYACKALHWRLDKNAYNHESGSHEWLIYTKIVRHKWSESKCEPNPSTNYTIQASFVFRVKTRIVITDFALFSMICNDSFWDMNHYMIEIRLWWLP